MGFILQLSILSLAALVVCGVPQGLVTPGLSPLLSRQIRSGTSGRTDCDNWCTNPADPTSFKCCEDITPIDECTAPWVSIGSGSSKGCFLFMEDRMDWHNARSYCQKKDGDLVVLETESERRDLINYMDSNGLRDGHGRYLGANARHGSWRWLNDNYVTNGWRQYNDVQPDSASGKDACMYLYTSSYPSGRYDLLSDTTCTRQRSFICGKVKYTRTGLVCPEEYRTDGDCTKPLFWCPPEGCEETVQIKCTTDAECTKEHSPDHICCRDACLGRTCKIGE